MLLEERTAVMTVGSRITCHDSVELRVSGHSSNLRHATQSRPERKD